MADEHWTRFHSNGLISSVRREADGRFLASAASPKHWEPRAVVGDFKRAQSLANGMAHEMCDDRCGKWLEQP